MPFRLQQLLLLVLASFVAAAALLFVARAIGRLDRATPPTPVASVATSLATAVMPGAGTASATVEHVATGTAGGPPIIADPSTTAPPARRIGVIAGHWQYDTGAVCPDGLREVDVTTDVALRVQAILEARGYVVDVLPDHDPAQPGPPLQNYAADALVSVHVDSCEAVGSGFKVARWIYSDMPEVEDRLVGCLYDAYAAATLLDADDDTITPDMTNYYAFREVAVTTPAAIIEVGFLGGDRPFIEEHAYEIARGIADGVRCFVEGPGVP